METERRKDNLYHENWQGSDGIKHAMYKIATN